jgi:hypothetical protein
MSAYRLVWMMAAAAALSACAYRPAVGERPALTHDTYNFPLTSPGAQFATLTPPVQKAIRAQVGGAEIRAITKDPVSGLVNVYMVNEALFPTLHVAPDGSILAPDLTVAVGAPRDESATLVGGSAAGLKPGELPGPVRDTLQQKAPGAPIASISKETWGNQSVYIIVFAPNSGQPRMYIAGDGAVLHQAPK